MSKRETLSSSLFSRFSSFPFSLFLSPPLPIPLLVLIPRASLSLSLSLLSVSLALFRDQSSGARQNCISCPGFRLRLLSAAWRTPTSTTAPCSSSVQVHRPSSVQVALPSRYRRPATNGRSESNVWKRSGGEISPLAHQATIIINARRLYTRATTTTVCVSLAYVWFTTNVTDIRRGRTSPPESSCLPAFACLPSFRATGCHGWKSALLNGTRLNALWFITGVESRIFLGTRASNDLTNVFAIYNVYKDFVN